MSNGIIAPTASTRKQLSIKITQKLLVRLVGGTLDHFALAKKVDLQVMPKLMQQGSYK